MFLLQKKQKLIFRVVTPTRHEIFQNCWAAGHPAEVACRGRGHVHWPLRLSNCIGQIWGAVAAHQLAPRCSALQQRPFIARVGPWQLRQAVRLLWLWVRSALPGFLSWALGCRDRLAWDSGEGGRHLLCFDTRLLRSACMRGASHLLPFIGQNKSPALVWGMHSPRVKREGSKSGTKFNLSQVLGRKILGSGCVHCAIFMEASEAQHTGLHSADEGPVCRCVKGLAEWVSNSVSPTSMRPRFPVRDSHFCAPFSA